MNIALRRAVPAALTVAMALSATIAYAPAAAYADTHSSTELTLRQVDNPFNVGPDERHTIDEGDDLTLKGNITGGFGDVSHQWFVSTDGGKTWNEVEGASGSAFDIECAKAGEYIYRFVATDRYGNTAHQDFYVTGCSAPDELSGWTCDAAGTRIESGQSVRASWSGQVSADIAARLGADPYLAGQLAYAYVDAVLKGAVLLDRQSPCVGDVVTATPSGLNVPEDRVTYQWYRVKDGVETAVDGATEPSYTATDTDMGCSLVCRLTSTDPIYQGSISSGPADPVRSPEAFAVYSADDGSLCFYKRAAKP